MFHVRASYLEISVLDTLDDYLIISCYQFVLHNIFGTVHHFGLNPELKCVQGLTLWRNSSSEINDELYKGYRKGNPEGKINEIVAGMCTCYIQLIKKI